MTEDKRRRQPTTASLGAALAAALLVSCGTSGDKPSAAGATSTPPLRPELAAGWRDPEIFPLKDLMGHTLPELRARLGRGLLLGDAGPALVMARPDGAPLSFLTLSDALADPWQRERTRRGLPPGGEWTTCLTNFGVNAALSGGSAAGALLVFNGDLLAEIRRPQNSRSAPEERRIGAGAPPLDHAFLGRPGQLPLGHGAEFLHLWNGQRLGPSDQITVKCGLERGAPAQPLRGLTGQPTTPLAAFIADEGEADPAIRLGEAIDGGVAAVLKKRKQTYWYAGKEGYGVLVLDSAPHGLVFAGVRNDHVEWLASEPADTYGFGFPPNLLCVNDDNVPGAVRKGCSTSGAFTPTR